MGPILCETRLRLVYGRTWWSSSGRSRCSWSQSCSRSVCNEAPYETKLMFPYETRLMALIIPYETRLMTWTGPGGVHPTDRAAAGPSHARAFPLSDAHPQVIPELQTKPHTPNPKPQTPNPKPQTPNPPQTKTKAQNPNLEPQNSFVTGTPKNISNQDSRVIRHWRRRVRYLPSGRDALRAPRQRLSGTLRG